MTKLQRFRKINQENKDLTTKKIRKYVDSHYSKSPHKAEQLTPLYFTDDNELDKIIKLMKETSKLLLNKDYIWDYFTAYLPNKNRASEEVIKDYNERQYQNKIIRQILKCGDDEEKEARLIKKLDTKSIQMLRAEMGCVKPRYSNSCSSQRYTRGNR